MAKKIRFPLEMEHGVEVRSVGELKEHFFLPQVLMYLSNGKLVTWLKDRYAADIAEVIEQLDPSDEELPRKISEIFDVPYDETARETLEKAEERRRKLAILKKYTTEQKYIDALDSMAFEQDDLYDLLDDGITDIYLCGDSFSIPLAKSGVQYFGVNNPIVVIDSKIEIDWTEKNIRLSDVKYDCKYQEVVDKALETKKGTAGNSYLNFMLSPTDRAASEESFAKISKEMEKLNYDINRDIAGATEDTKMSVIRMAKFENLIEDINRKIKKNNGLFYYIGETGSTEKNTCLGLIYDYDKLNEYAKIIMEKSRIILTIRGDSRTDAWGSKHGGLGEFKNPTARIDAAKEFVQYCHNGDNVNEGIKLVFWALMILAVDKTDADAHLSLICDFAHMLRITDKELEDMVYVIKKIYNVGPTEYTFKSTCIWRLFFSTLNLNRNN